MMMMLMAGDSWKSSNMTFRIPACAFNHILVAVWGSIWSRSVWMYSIDRYKKKHLEDERRMKEEWMYEVNGNSKLSSIVDFFIYK